MKHEKISIKWKIFLYLLIFTGILLTVLWLLQICYLDSFYKRIKSNEAESLIGQITDVLESDAGNAEEQIDNLAASRNMTVLVTDMDWNTLYSAEYIANSRLSTMPSEQVEWVCRSQKCPMVRPPLFVFQSGSTARYRNRRCCHLFHILHSLSQNPLFDNGQSLGYTVEKRREKAHDSGHSAQMLSQ